LEKLKVPHPRSSFRRDLETACYRVSPTAPRGARTAITAKVHQHWPDNVFIPARGALIRTAKLPFALLFSYRD
jgi:hypothetical protein